MESTWNCHNYISMDLERISKQYMPSITADDIDFGAFVDTMVNVLMMQKIDAQAVQCFSLQCSEFTGIRLSQIPPETANKIYNEFKRLLQSTKEKI